MKRLAALAIAVVLGAMCAQGQQQHPAPKSSWVKSEPYPRLTRQFPHISVEQFVLRGRFLVPPKYYVYARGKPPELTVQCVVVVGEPQIPNLFSNATIEVGAMLDGKRWQPLTGVGPARMRSVKVEYRRDNEREAQRDFWPVTLHRTLVDIWSSPLCNGCTFARLLYQHGEPVRQLIISLPDGGGNEVEAQFDIPNPREVADACELESTGRVAN